MESKNVRTHSVDRLCTKTAIYAQLLSENYKRQKFIRKFIKLEILNFFLKKKKALAQKVQLHLNVYTRKLMALKKLNCSIFDRFFPQKLRSQMYNIDFNRKENMYEAKLQWRLRTNVLYLMLNL